MTSVSYRLFLFYKNDKQSCEGYICHKIRTGNGIRIEKHGNVIRGRINLRTPAVYLIFPTLYIWTISTLELIFDHSRSMSTVTKLVTLKIFIEIDILQWFWYHSSMMFLQLFIYLFISVSYDIMRFNDK